MTKKHRGISDCVDYDQENMKNSQAENNLDKNKSCQLIGVCCFGESQIPPSMD